MKRRLVELVLVVTMSLSFTPHALAHDGTHDKWEFCRFLGNTMAWTVAAVVLVSSPALPASPAILGSVAGSIGMIGNAGPLVEKYLVHIIPKVDTSRVNWGAALTNGRY